MHSISITQRLQGTTVNVIKASDEVNQCIADLQYLRESIEVNSQLLTNKQ